MKNHLSYKLIGSTRDDAVGEAFDKSAKLLGLPYPGGPALAKLAVSGNANAIVFPRGMVKDANLDFSFSGLKTSVATYLHKHPDVDPADIAASFQEAAIDSLIQKTVRAIGSYKPRTVLIAGGVAANLRLRETMRATLAQKFPDVFFLEPDLAYVTDNAAMIGAAGCVRFLRGFSSKWQNVSVDPQLPLR